MFCFNHVYIMITLLVHTLVFMKYCYAYTCIACKHAIRQSCWLYGAVPLNLTGRVAPKLSHLPVNLPCHAQWQYFYKKSTALGPAWVMFSFMHYTKLIWKCKHLNWWPTARITTYLALNRQNVVYLLKFCVFNFRCRLNFSKNCKKNYLSNGSMTQFHVSQRNWAFK